MIVVGALSQSVVERWLGASVAQPGRCFSTPESIRLVSGKARLSCPAGSRVQTPPEAPNKNPSLEEPSKDPRTELREPQNLVGFGFYLQREGYAEQSILGACKGVWATLCSVP